MIKKNLTKLSPSLRYYYKNYESRKEKNRIRREVFRNSLEGKSKIKEYSQSTKGREVSRKATRKYQKTKKGSEKLLNYNRSQRGKEVRKKYYESKKSKKWWHEHRKKIDYKLSANMRKTLSVALSKNRIIKSKKTLELLGCSVHQLKKHLKNKFKKGMGFENYGKWHIDHIKPISLFDLSKKSEQKKCFSYKNLQPLWAKENIRKSNKY